MSSNSEKMTVEERLAERIKESNVGTFFDDEDLLKIAHRAMEQAFFKSREVREGSYGSTKTLPPLIVEMCSDYMREKMTERLNPIIDELIATDEVQELLAQQVVGYLPELLRSIVANAMDRSITHMSLNTSNVLKMHVQNTLKGMGNHG